MSIMVYLLSAIYSMAVGWTLGVALFIILLMTFSRSIKERLSRIETRFIDNLNERELRKTGAKNSLVPTMHLAYESLLVAVQRDDKYIQPEASTVFAPGDVLWLVGDVNRLKALSV